MTLEIGPQNMPDLIAGVGLLALAALLLWVAPTNRVHRAFALLQVLNGASSLTWVGTTGYEGTDPLLSGVLANVNTYFMLAVPFAAAFFAVRFFDGERRSPTARVIAWVLLLGAVVTLGAFALDHDHLSARRDDGLVVLGPLTVVSYSGNLTFGAVALLCALKARGTPAGADRQGLVLASLAFLLLPTYWGTAFAAGGILAPEWFALETGHAAIIAFSGAWPWVVALVVAVIAWAMFLTPPLRGDTTTRSGRRLLAAGVFLSVVTALVVVQMLQRDLERFGSVASTLDGVWRVVMTGILSYALLKQRLFDVEVRLRFAISRSTIAAVFIAVFFIASEAAQQFFGETLGSTYVGIAAAGALVFALAPLQKLAEGLAARAVPVAEGAPDAVSSREQAYRAAARRYLRDGQLTREEEVELAHLAGELGLHAGRAMEIRHEIEGEGAGAVA